ncbi:hypothetical protein [Paenibacillus lactis]|uniref:hypothetical protein n=1 Tax=Paenibacillus lactis TaxID=228574 RepID=UPI0011A68694
MNHRMLEVPHKAAGVFKQERWLIMAGLLGFLLAGICGIWVLIYGAPVAPEGNIGKAFSFNAALGIFLLSTAAILPFSGLGTRSKAWFRWSYILLALYSYFAETVQNFRGVDPRYVQNGSVFDEAVSNLFVLVALLLVLFYVIIAVQYFRRRVLNANPEIVLGIRYAMIAVIISFAAGIWISINSGRFTGAGGNIIWLHGFGFHALQVVPFAAWLSMITLNPASRFIVIHLTGICYLLGLMSIGWQTLLGYTLFEWSALPIGAAFFFLVAFILSAWMVGQAYVQHVNQRINRSSHGR